MVTLRRDGSPHVARVGVGLVEGKLWSSAGQDRVRTGHVRRDPRAALFLQGGHDQEWLGLDCRVSILEGDDAPQLNLALYRELKGEPDDLQEYLDAMVAERRLIYEFEVIRAYGQF
jgi:hypothetical protein